MSRRNGSPWLYLTGLVVASLGLFYASWVIFGTYDAPTWVAVGWVVLMIFGLANALDWIVVMTYMLLRSRR